jgi:VanZ family protein
MSRHAKFVLFGRIAFALIVVSVSILVFGPFGGAEEHFGLTDKEAHTLAFYTLTALGLLAMPRVRKFDVVLALMTFGALIEVVQTFIGRDGEIGDWLADSLGIGLAYAPMLFEKARLMVRGEQADHPQRRKGDRATEITSPERI